MAHYMTLGGCLNRRSGRICLGSGMLYFMVLLLYRCMVLEVALWEYSGNACCIWGSTLVSKSNGRQFGTHLKGLCSISNRKG